MPTVTRENAPHFYAECWRVICGGIEGSRISESPTVFVGTSGLHSAMLNGVIVTGDADVPAIAKAVGGIPDPHVVIDRAGRSAPVEAWLDERGYDLIQTAPLMLLDEPPQSADLHPTLRIVRATRAEDAASHAGVVSQVFDQPAEVTAASLSPASLRSQSFSARIGLIDNQPVTTAMSVVTQGVGCVYNVATLPEFRGRGFGEAMTLAVMADAADAGARAIILQSSNAGLRLYERLGFRTIDEWTNWLAP